MTHRPRMSEERAARIRQWHEDAYQDGVAVGEQSAQYLGYRFVVPPQVMPITPVSHLLGEAVRAEARSGEHVLDMGTGSGVNAVLAAGVGSRVVAVDINPIALAAAAANAERNEVAGRIEFRHSDVFGAVPERFDLIVFDPPFRWFAPRDAFEVATADADYRALTRFFGEAREHLTERGRMLIFFGTSGDLAYLEQLIDTAGFGRDVVARAGVVKDDWPVEYLTMLVR